MQVIFLDWRYLQLYFLPTDKNFKASFFNWYVFPFQLVKSANTEFQLIKINRNLALIRLGFLKVVFPIWPPLIPRHHLYLCNREMPKKKKKNPMKGWKSVEGRRKSPYLLKDFRNEIFRKDVAYDNIKSQKKQFLALFLEKTFSEKP